MFPWNLHVSIIEPGFMRTPIIEEIQNKSFEEFWFKFSKDIQKRWGEEFLKEYYQIQAKNIFIKICGKSNESCTST
jgi:hypothetical protein